MCEAMRRLFAFLCVLVLVVPLGLYLVWDAQTRALGWAWIAGGASFLHLLRGDFAHLRSIWQGFRSGRRARWLAGEDYLALFEQPLDMVRQRLGIAPPTAYLAVPAELR